LGGGMARISQGSVITAEVTFGCNYGVSFEFRNVIHKT